MLRNFRNWWAINGYWAILLPFAALAVAMPYASNATVPLLIVTAFTSRRLPVTGQRIVNFASSVPARVLMAFLGWMLVSSLWSIRFPDAMALAIRLIVIMAGGMLLIDGILQMPKPWIQRMATWLIRVVMVAVAIYAIEILLDGRLACFIKGWDQYNHAQLFNRLARGSAMLVILIWPVLLLLRTRRYCLPARGLLLLSVILVISCLPMWTTKLAMITAIAAFAGTWLIGKWFVRIVFSLNAFLATLAPLLAANADRLGLLEGRIYGFSSSWRHRLAIWEFVAHKAMERPFTGYGINASREIGGTLSPYLLNPFAPVELRIFDIPLPLHPHDLPLQIWLETGAIGILLYAILLIFLQEIMIHHLKQRSMLAMASAVYAGLLCISALSFGAFQNWWLCGIWFTVGAVILAIRNHSENQIALCCQAAD